MAEFKLSLGLEKLIEVVAQGIGGLAKPWMMRRVAAAEAERMKILSGAEKEIAAQRLLLPAAAPGSESAVTGTIDLKSQTDEGSMDPAELFERRVAQRIENRENRRQRNIETVVTKAAEKIAGEAEVSDEPVDEDWVSRFFSNVQDVSDERLQRLWSFLLAREVAQPKTVSLRTLEVLRNLSPWEADAFQELLRCTCESDGELFFLATRSVPLHREELEDCGLLLGSKIMQIPSERSLVFEHAGLKLRLCAHTAEMFEGWNVNVINLTRAGRDLARIAWRPLDPDRELLEGIVESYEKHFDVEVYSGGECRSLVDFLGRK